MASKMQMVEETAEVMNEKAEQKVQKKRIPKDLKDVFNTAVDKAVDKANKDADKKIEASEKSMRKEMKREIADVVQAHRELSDEYNLYTSNADLKAIANSREFKELKGKMESLAKDIEDLKDDKESTERFMSRLGAENATLATIGGLCAGICLVVLAFLIAGRLM